MSNVGISLTLAFTHQVGIVGIVGISWCICWHPPRVNGFLSCKGTMKARTAAQGAAALPAIPCVDPIKLQGRHGAGCGFACELPADPKEWFEKGVETPQTLPPLQKPWQQPTLSIHMLLLKGRYLSTVGICLTLAFTHQVGIAGIHCWHQMESLLASPGSNFLSVSFALLLVPSRQLWGG